MNKKTDRPESGRGKGTHKAELMKLVEAAYDEGSFSKNEVEIADPSAGDMVRREVSFTFSIPSIGNERLRSLYDLAKRVGI